MVHLDAKSAARPLELATPIRQHLDKMLVSLPSALCSELT